MSRQTTATIKKPALWRRTLAWTTSLAMILMFVPAVAWARASWTISNVSYLDETGAKQTCQTVTEVSRDNTAWNDRWYVAKGDITIGSRVTASGDVHLILLDGCSLTINGGIGLATNASLSIYAQSTGDKMGKLVAQSPPRGSSSIGSGWMETCKLIRISGGEIKSTSSEDGGAGIGSGNSGECDSIIISGGSINSKGGQYAAGIGSGYSGTCGSIKILSGNVESEGGTFAAGIGSGGVIYDSDSSSCKEIQISGGNINSKGFGQYGAGIGSGGTGNHGGSVSCEAITISGGNINSKGAENGAGIGSGRRGICNSITVEGSPTIFTGDITSRNTALNSGVIFQSNSNGKIYGSNVAPNHSFTIPDNKTLDIEGGKTLTISNGIALTNNGSISIKKDGTLVNNGNLTNNSNLAIEDEGKFTNNVKITNSGTITGISSKTVDGTATSKVAFEPNDGTINDDNISAYVYGVEVKLPADVIKTGHTFVGWHEKSDFSDNAATLISKDATGDKAFYAKWIPNNYTLTFDGDGGSVYPPSITNDYGSSIASPKCTREGYTFNGWDKTLPSTMPAENQTFTAQWVPNYYRIVFDGNGASGSMADQSFIYDREQALSKNTFSMYSCSFTGWRMEGDASGKIYKDGELVKNLTTDNDGMVKLIAQWSHYHVPSTLPAKDPTCTEDGLTQGSACSTCGAVLKKQDTVPALGHDAETIPAVDATCTEDGLEQGSKCARCGETLVAQEIIPALGHEWGNWETVKKATLKAKGLKTRACLHEGCDITQERSIAKLKMQSVTINGITYTCNGKTATVIKAKGNVKSAKIPAYIKIDDVKYPVATIASRAFKNHKKLQLATLGANMKLIGTEAFKDCKKLKIVTVNGPAFSSIGARAFKNCNKLKSITFSNVTDLKAGKKTKDCLKGSKVKTVIAKFASSKKVNKCEKSYEKVFTKKNCGKSSVKLEFKVTSKMK